MTTRRSVCGFSATSWRESLETPGWSGRRHGTSPSLRRCGARLRQPLARDIVSGWEASVQDDVAEVTPATPMKKLENIAKVTPTMKKLPQPKAVVGQKQDVSANPNTETKRPPKLAGEPLAKKTLEIIKRASDPAAGFLDGDRAGLSLEDKMEVTKRKLRQGYQEAEDATARADWCRRQDDLSSVSANETVHQLHGQEDLRGQDAASHGLGF
ncbi:hypothetical protein ZWY2020_059219 [Hordeum vulgare]|nr:hypothetical protein ZWY2020_059219 [Hordeum vulgare]